jgi:dCMP deaminase
MNKIVVADWDNYFMQIADLVGSRSTCVSHKIGAILVKDRRVLVTGYNGTPSGFLNCSDGGCERCRARVNGSIGSGEGYDTCVCCHSEMNLASQAALHGISPEGSTIYCYYTSCQYCSLLLISMKISRYVYVEPFKGWDIVSDSFRKASIQVDKLDGYVCGVFPPITHDILPGLDKQR